MKKRHCILLAAFVLLAVACGSNTNEENPDNGSKKNPETGLTTVTYQLSNDEIANPERGLYTQHEVFYKKYARLSDMRQWRSQGKTLVQLMYYLPEFRDRDFPELFITQLEVDLQSVRDARMKAILRFAYTDKQNGADAPMHIIKRHLDQIKPVLHKYVGVIACVQAGFIGAWGEWYYSTNKLNNATAYRELLNKWLEVLPAERSIQVRTPKYKQDFVGNATPLNNETAYKNKPAARIAHHNDAFMTDQTNMGTYINIEKDKKYVAQDALYVPLGGETAVPPSGVKWATGEEAWNEVNYLHWSFLNDAYYTDLLNSWKVGGYFDKIKKLLGYRIALQKAEYSEKIAQGSDFVLNLWFVNQGTACMYNARPTIFILRPLNDIDEYMATSDIDLRMVQPGKQTPIKTRLRIPQGLPAGKYKLYMWLPDASKMLQNIPEYAVQLGNTTAWERETGYNDMNITLDVVQDKNAKPGTSSFIFTKKK